MFQNFASLAFVTIISLLAGCAAPMGSAYGHPSPAVHPVPQVQVPVSGVYCNIDGVVTKEANNAACEAKAKQKAESLSAGAKVDIKSQAHAPTCANGKTWTQLNWPGHPQHDSYVCLPDGDPHRH